MGTDQIGGVAIGMRYVIGLRGRIEDTVERARALEEAGWDGIGVGDHRTAGSRHMWATLGAAAAATSQVRLLSGFANNLLRHPVDFARAAVTLNAVAAGRFEAGLGAGWRADDVVITGDDLPSPRERVDRFHEAIEIIATLFRERSCRYRGAYFKVDVDEFPIEGAPPPLIAAVGGPRSCRLIAPLVDRVEVMFGPAVSGGDLDFDVFAQVSEEELGSRVEIVREVAPNTPVGVGVFVAAGTGPEIDRLRDVAGAGLQRDLIGEPRAVADALRRLDELGVDRVGLTPMTMETAERLAPELLA